jgi:hypothetical protein
VRFAGSEELLQLLIPITEQAGKTVGSELDSLTVDYDATRLKERDVEAALACAGVAVQPAA